MSRPPAKSTEYLRGYADLWIAIPPTSSHPDYVAGRNEGLKAKRILEGMSFSTDNSRHEELSSAIL